MVYRDASGRFCKMPVARIGDMVQEIWDAVEDGLPRAKPPYIPGHTVVARFAGGSWQLVRGTRTPTDAITVAIFDKLTAREKYDCKLSLVATGQL